MGPRYEIASFVDFFDVMWDDFEGFFRSLDSYDCDCKAVFPLTAYPPTDIYVEKDKTLVFEFAVAGYEEDDIHLDFDGSYMELSIKKREKKRDDIKILRNRISATKIYNRYGVPSDKYDYAKAEAKLKNGILVVKIPSKIPKEARELKIQVD